MGSVLRDVGSPSGWASPSGGCCCGPGSSFGFCCNFSGVDIPVVSSLVWHCCVSYLAFHPPPPDALSYSVVHRQHCVVGCGPAIGWQCFRFSLFPSWVVVSKTQYDVGFRGEGNDGGMIVSVKKGLHH